MRVISADSHMSVRALVFRIHRGMKLCLERLFSQ